MHKKLLVILLIVLAVVIGTPILVLGYAGFVPGVSTVMGTNKPRDLGITFSAEDYQSGTNKAGTRVTTRESGPGSLVAYSGSSSIDVNFTSEELSAFVTECPGSICLIESAQVRLNADGTAEISGILAVDHVVNFAKGLGYSDEDIAEGKDYIKYVSGNPPIYASGTFTIVNNQVSLDVTRTEIGRVPLPQSFITGNDGVAESVIEDVINRIPNANIRSASIVDGQLHFDGTIPAVQVYAP